MGIAFHAIRTFRMIADGLQLQFIDQPGGKVIGVALGHVAFQPARQRGRLGHEGLKSDLRQENRSQEDVRQEDGRDNMTKNDYGKILHRLIFLSNIFLSFLLCCSSGLGIANCTNIGPANAKPLPHTGFVYALCDFSHGCPV